MSSRKGRWRPMKDAIWLLIVITTVSMVITLHLQDGLGWLGSGAQVKIRRSDLPHSNDGDQVVRIFDKWILSSNINNSLAAGIKQDRVRPLFNNPPEVKNPDFSVSSKSYSSSKGNSLRRSWSLNAHTTVFLSDRQEGLKDPDNNSPSDSFLTRLSDRRSVRDGYRYVEGTKLKGSDWNVRSIALGPENPETIGGQFPPGLPSRKDATERVFASRGRKIVRQLGLSNKSAYPQRQERKLEQGENSVGNEQGKDNGEKKELKWKSGTKQDRAGNKGRLSHSFNGGRKDSDTVGGQSSQAQVTYGGRPRTLSTMDSSNSSVSLLQGSGFTTEAGQEDTSVDNPIGQDRSADPQALYDHISQVDASSRLGGGDPPTVLVRGSVASIKHHLPLIEAAFHKYKADVSFSAYNGRSDSETPRNDVDKAWSIIMCLNSTGKGDDCVVTSQGKIFTNKTNVIPHLQSVLVSPRLLCLRPGDRDSKDSTENREDTDPIPSTKGRWCGGLLPCYPLDNGQASLHMTQPQVALLENTGSFWCRDSDGVWLSSPTEGNDKGRESDTYIPCKGRSWKESTAAMETIKLAPRESVLVPLPKNLLSLDGQSPLAWQLKVLVTSLRPPRVYIHPSGLVWEGLASQGHKKALSLQELHKLLQELSLHHGDSISTTEDIKHAITQLIRLTHWRLTTEGDTEFVNQPKSFQLFDAVFVFNSSFHPFILKIIQPKYQGGLNSLSAYLQEQNILEDLAPMVLARDKTATNIHQALISLGFDTFTSGKVCSHRSRTCLQPDHIAFLLDTRREQTTSRNWRRVIPNTEQACLPHSKMTTQELGLQHSIDNLAMLVEMLFMCPSNVHLNMTDTRAFSSTVMQKQISSKPADARSNFMRGESVTERQCLEDSTRLAYLQSIVTRPYLQLYPEFSPLTSDYQVWTDYNTTVVNFHVLPANCRARARLAEVDDGHRSDSWNISLGLGENVLHIKVEDTWKSPPASLATYRIVIHRRSRDMPVDRSDGWGKEQLRVCALKQDCALRYLPEKPCGLMTWEKPEDGGQGYIATWDQFLVFYTKLPYCQLGYADDGQWLIPCSSCGDPSSCAWKDAVWHQGSCREAKLSHPQLQQCFKDKQVLFVGDSTNRGILNYITKRLNGSLLEWDKTHTMRVYPALNQGSTVFGFAYYPQFWLDTRSRPNFDVAFSRLRKRAQTVSGQWETVLVLGGVHWLTRRHIKALQSRLDREGLRNVTVVVKGLGAGFHQPVTGVYQLSLADQRKLHSSNKELLSYCRAQGVHTVDTFSMTMARFRDFRQGKCACHFHRVSADQPSVMNKLSPATSSQQVSTTQVQYSVHGEINAAYSEMVINRICLGQDQQNTHKTI